MKYHSYKKKGKKKNLVYTIDMGLCYSLRPRLFGDLSGSISNGTSDSDQPPEPAVPYRTGGSHQEDTGGYVETSSLRDGSGQVRHGDLVKFPPGEPRGTDNTGTDVVLIQNGGGGGGGGGKGTGKDRSRRLQLLQKTTSTENQKNWDKLLVEEKEAEREAKKISKNIDRALKELKREYKQTHRLLLLGRLATLFLHYLNHPSPFCRERRHFRSLELSVLRVLISLPFSTLNGIHRQSSF